MVPNYTYALTLQVGELPQLSFNASFPMDAYLKVEEPVAAGTSTTISLSPGPVNKIRAILVAANPDQAITFKPVASSIAIPLDQPYFASGNATVSLLGNDLDQLVLTNGSASDTIFTILVAKDV